MSGRDDVPFWGLTPQQIYEQLRGGPGSGKLADAGRAASQEWHREEERANEIRALAVDMETGWDGQASDAAHGAAGPLAESALQGAGQLHTSEQLLNQQSEVFHAAANSVVPVPDKPPESNILNDMIPWETDLDRHIREYQASAQHNIEVFRNYDTTSLDHEAPLAREYSTVTHSGGDISVRGPGDTIDRDDYRRSGGGDPGNYSAPSGGDSGGSGTSDGASGGSPVDRSQTSGAAGSSTQTSQVSPSATPGSGLQSVVLPGSPAGPTTGSPGGGLTGAGPVVGATPTGFGGGVGGRGGGAGSGGGRGGVAGGGPGVRGGAPGAGAGASAAEQPAQRGGLAGARGAAGMGGAPMGAAGRSKDGEDSEHQRKVLIEPDPEATFGTDELTAPQVIGDPRYEDV